MLKIELINHTPNPEFSIVNAARICYDSPNDSVIESNGKIVLGMRDKALLKKLVELKHFSTLEHASFTFKISGISRACTHQLVRHRMASYSQRSQRYVNEHNFEYIIPDSISENMDALDFYKTTMDKLNDYYQKLIDLGVRKEDARYILPNSCLSEIVITMNARSLKNFFELRLDKHAQWEIRKVAKVMYSLVNECSPILFPKLD